MVQWGHLSYQFELRTIGQAWNFGGKNLSSYMEREREIFIFFVIPWYISYISYIKQLVSISSAARVFV
jgi:hypothetical protein